MDPEFYMSNHFIALSVGMLIFLITLFLSAKEWIDFPLTVIFLLFAIAASIGIENYDLFRVMEHHNYPESRTAAMEQILNDNREMKAEIELQNKKLQNLIDATEKYLISSEKDNKSVEAATPSNQ